MQRKCHKHGLTEFGTSGKFGRFKCRLCNKEMTLERRRRVKQKLIDLKGGKCEECGYSKCMGALTFHHINSDEKDFELNSRNLNRKEEVLLEELKKCRLLCHNCHAEEHWGK